MPKQQPQLEHGRIVSVAAVTAGDELAANASSGATKLTLTDTSDFDEDGGMVLINGTTYTYTAVDMDAETITLATGLTAAASTEDRVDVYDPVTGRPVIDYSAQVVLPGQEDGDPIEADVDQSLVSVLSTEVRVAAQSVTLPHDGYGYRVVAVHGKEASQDAVTYMPGGFTTRTDDSQSGIEILGPDAGTPSVNLYTSGGVQSMTISGDGSEGIIEFFTGTLGETPGAINPAVVGGQHQLAITTSKSAAPNNEPAKHLDAGQQHGAGTTRGRAQLRLHRCPHHRQFNRDDHRDRRHHRGWRHGPRQSGADHHPAVDHDRRQRQLDGGHRQHPPGHVYVQVQARPAAGHPRRGPRPARPDPEDLARPGRGRGERRQH